LTWVERNRDQIEKIRAYVLEFGEAHPAEFEWFQAGSHPLFPLAVESDRGSALLLAYCALYQGISARKLSQFLAYLWKEYDADFFRLNKLPFDELQARVANAPGLGEWDLRGKAPGILRSVCDFFFKHGKLLPWVAQTGGEAAIQILADEIFMMGKTSEFKSKPRYFLWLLTQLPDAEPQRFWTPETLLPITPGHLRFVREFGPLKERRRSPWATPQEKLSYLNRFFRMLFPDRPWIVYAALDAYLKPAASAAMGIASEGAPSNPLRAEEKKWLCRETLGGCLQCPLAPTCPGREDV